ncbi:MAG: hypothetical protein KF812_09355 [Fimbriimonadaceae bacterium]|nr:hypothetical protein [Fimbriimonadaceae bacterium]
MGGTHLQRSALVVFLGAIVGQSNAGVDSSLYPDPATKPNYFSGTYCPVIYEGESTATNQEDPPQIENQITGATLKIGGETVFSRTFNPARFSVSGTVYFDSSHFYGQNELLVELILTSNSDTVPPATVTITVKNNRGTIATRRDWEGTGNDVAVNWQRNNVDPPTEWTLWEYPTSGDGASYTLGGTAWRSNVAVYDALRNDGFADSKYTTNGPTGFWNWSALYNSLSIANIAYIATHGGSSERTPLSRVVSRITSDSSDFNIVYDTHPTLATLPKELVFGQTPPVLASPNNTFPTGITYSVMKTDIKLAYDGSANAPAIEPPLYNEGSQPIFFALVAACHSGDTDDIARGLIYPYFDITNGVPNMAYVGYKGEQYISTIAQEADDIFLGLKSGKALEPVLEDVLGTYWNESVSLLGDPYSRISSVYTGNADEPLSWWREL